MPVTYEYSDFMMSFNYQANSKIPKDPHLEDNGLELVRSCGIYGCVVDATLSPRLLSVNEPLCLLHLSYGMLCRDISGNPLLLTLLREI